MRDGQPLGDHPSHGVAIDMGACDPQVIKQRDGVVCKSLDRIGWSIWLVAFPCSSVIRHDDPIAGREIIADLVPITMIAAIAADEQKRIACSHLLIIETRPVWDRK